MAFGGWNINVTVGKMPQKVATAMGKLGESMLGADYEPIAYLGSQTVNGINHAVLAQQVVINGRDTKNIVVLLFNEKPNTMEVSLIGIDRIVESGDVMGGTVVDALTEIPADAMSVWNEAFDGFVGCNATPFALVGTQVVNGVNYIFAAELATVAKNPEKKVVLVTINSHTKEVAFADILVTKHDISLGYAFTWLTNGATM